VRTTIVIPTYNEAGNVERLFSAIRAAVTEPAILLVDDNSPDGTADLAESLNDRFGPIQVLRRPGKAGLGAAYRAGLRRAIDDGADICIQMDADGSHPANVLPALIAIVEHGADLAIGSRYVPGGITENWPWQRRWLSRWANRYVSAVLGLAINDATAGYRAYSAAALERMDFQTVKSNGYGFQVEMTHRLITVGGKIVEYPIVFRDRTAGDSKMSGGIIKEALTMVIKLRVGDIRGRRERRRRGG